MAVLPIIKDEYVKHHQNLGGSIYLFLERKRDVVKARDILLDVEG